MNRILIFGLFLLLSVPTVFAQSASSILTIGKNEYSAAEFWYVYNKNKDLPNFQEKPEEFSQRFINYKLKVVEAIDQGLDTTSTFLAEYRKYTEDLKNSFLVDSSALKSVVDEAITNMGTMLDASHILITVAPDALPVDTLKAWNLIHTAKKEIESGMDFNEAAVKYSQDPSAVSNKGHLGYFSAFKMIYPFEKAAFNTPVNHVSEIVRTDFGYHLIYVHEQMEHPGYIRVAHIMKTFPQNVTDEQKESLKQSIDSIYQLLKDNENFEELAEKYSDDKYSAQSGGEMQPFSLDNMVPEFAEASFALNADGDISEPVLTNFGWHIIKRLDRTPLVDPATQTAEIMSRLGRDGRDKTGQKAYLANCIKSSFFVMNNDLKEELITNIEKGVNSESEILEVMKEQLDENLFTYRNDHFTLQSFLNWAQRYSAPNQKGVAAFKKRVNDYIETSVLEVEKRDLADNNEKYRFLANEYYDGLLIFEISDREIWSKVGEDTLALENYYQKNKHEFADHPQLEGTICLVTTKRLKKIANKTFNKGESDKLVQILKSKSKSDEECQCQEGFFDFVVDDNNPVQSTKLPESNPFYNHKGDIYWIGDITQFEPKPYNQVRGEVMSAYQKELENEWVKNLRNKHQPIFNKKLLK